jgi:hypothetical protein
MSDARPRGIGESGETKIRRKTHERMIDDTDILAQLFVEAISRPTSILSPWNLGRDVLYQVLLVFSIEIRPSERRKRVRTAFV